MKVSREAARCFRLAALGLTERGGTPASAAAPGLRDTPAGGYRDALAARVPQPAPPAADASSRQVPTVEGAKRPLDAGLLAVWGPRGAPYVVSADDVGVFTRGALPQGEASARAFAPSAVTALARHGVAFLDAVVEVEREMRRAVAGGPVQRDAMHQRLREAVRPELLWACRGCGTEHVHPMVWRAACTMGGIGRDDAPGSRAVTYVAVERDPDPAEDPWARQELTRRALHHHGPLTPKELMQWLSVSPADARGRLEAVASELVEVDRAGERAFALLTDVPRLADPPSPAGVRLLGTGDPLLDGRDRATVIPDPESRKEVWKAISGPGVVLVDGLVIATWRATARRGALDVIVSPLGGAPLPEPSRIATEVQALAAARGLDASSVLLNP